MKNRILALLLIIVAVSVLVSFAYMSGDVAADDNSWPVLDETNRPIPAPWPEEPGIMPELVGGKVPDRPLVFSMPSTEELDMVDEPEAPIFNVWYGTTQKFGQLGNPQQWVNVIGNVAGIDSSDTMTYKLNNGPVKDLWIGPKGNRLDALGDFNIEIDYADLNPGNNKVEIMATDGVSPTMATVNVNYTAGKTWDSNTIVDWGSSTDIQDLAQVVDGYWQLSGNSVVIDSNNYGYDRLLAVGDETWQDYEISVPVTVYGLDPAGYQGASNGPGVGFIMRWLGHSKIESEQPNGDFERTGAIGWYRWAPDLTEALELRGYDWKRGTSFSQVMEFNTEYIFKMSVQSIPGDAAYYRLKFWRASNPEPSQWTLQGFGSETAPDAGSLLLVAHHVDAKFGQVTVTDLSTLRLNVNVDVQGQGDIIFNPLQEDFAYSERVRVSAIPEFGYEFTGWTGDYIGTDNPADFRIYRDMNMTAVFAPKAPTKLKVNIDGQGSVERNPNKSEYLWGEQVTVTAFPAASHVFSHWEGDITGLQNPQTIQMNEDKEITAIFEPKSKTTPKSDDFSQCELNSALWTVVNPAGDGALTVTGNTARFSIPAGSEHNMWNDNADALRIMQPTDNRNFEVEVKFEDLPNAKYQMEGILIEQNANNWLRFDYYHNGQKLIINASKAIGGGATNVRFEAVDPEGSNRAYLKVNRNGNKWTQSYSFNGTDWTTFVVFVQEIEVTSSGIFVGNTAQTPGEEPAFTTRADYFFNTEMPIDPEDQGNTVQVQTTGQGQVQVTPLKQTYECNETVTLTATPANEWIFTGWQGDLSGGTNPYVLTVRGDYDIVARFSQGADVFLPVVMRK